ncbi:MAG: PHP domain-containing protein [Nannocystaceae bacterium]
MLVDLHCHSTHSDGSLSAANVAERARDRRVKIFCLTDHDSYAGYEATAKVFAQSPGVVLRGLEMSCKHSGRTIHLLMYGLKPGPGLDALERRLEQVIAERRVRLRAIIGRLQELGVSLDEEALVASTHGKTPGRPDIAKALLEAGVVNSIRQAFDRFLRDGGPADVPFKRISLAEGLALGRAAGAKMSLAHPHTLRSHALVEQLFRNFQAEGLEGIEAFYGQYAHLQRRPWLQFAAREGLVATGGSDFHGEALPAVTTLGTAICEEWGRKLCDWLGVEAA